MDYVEQLVSLLEAYQVSAKGDLQIKEWYFGINESISVKVGMKLGQIGGVYTCPRAEASTRGKVVILWKDHKRSIAPLDSTTLDRFDHYLATWRKAAFAENPEAFLYQAEQYPQVALYDPQVARLVEEDRQPLFELLEVYEKAAKGAGIAYPSGAASATVLDQSIRNSRGGALSHGATSFSTSFDANQRYGRTFTSRRQISQAELDHLIHHTLELGRGLAGEGVTQSGEMELLLLPNVVKQLTGHYLLNNLNGNQVYHRKSAFSDVEFNVKKQVLREDMYLLVDTLEDYAQGAYISTFEGVPGGKKEMIRDGRLSSPILNLKYAHLMNRPPTPIPAGAGSVYFGSTAMSDYFSLLGSIERGLLICDVLGMHTQDPMSGQYSLTASNCLTIRDGQLESPCSAVISGNYFENLKHPETRLGVFPYDENPCLLIRGAVR